MLLKPGTSERDLERERASRDELADRIARRVAVDGGIDAAPGLGLWRYSAPSGPLHAVSEPSFCVIVQGSKELFLGNERYRYDESNYLLFSAALPVVGRIKEATKQRPFLALRVVLDPAVVSSVLLEANLVAPRTGAAVRAVAVSRLDVNLLDSVVRLVRLVDSPRDYGVLAPLAVREIVYRLALGDQAARLRQIARVAGHGNGIAKAIGLLRRDYDKPLRIAGMARQVAMSVSAFHHQFKAVTGVSPVQFQKRLRLQQARLLLLAGDVDAATAGFRVGYNEPSHFNRDYKRHFGEPPMRDIERLRERPAARPQKQVARLRT